MNDTLTNEIVVTLTASEATLAAAVGIRRELEARIAGRLNRFGAKDEKAAWGKHVCGALAECAFAKAFGLYWGGGVNTFRTDGDVGRFEVRWAGGDGTTARLKFRNDEREDVIGVLVTGAWPRLTVHGWLWAHEGKQERYLDRPTPGPPGYFVPVIDLHPCSSLPL